MELIYFAYGSNMHPAAMHAVCPAAAALGRALVHGRRLIFRSVISSELMEGSVLRGVMWSISRDDLENLDRLEDYPNLYERVAIRAEDVEGQARRAFMYVMRPERVPIAPPEPHYLALVLAAARHWGIPEDDILAAAAEARQLGAGAEIPPLPWNDEHWITAVTRAEGGEAKDPPRGR